MENCIEAVHHWMQTNFLKLNENKTEFIILGLSKQLKNVGNITIKIGEDIIPNVQAMKNLGIFLDSELKTPLTSTNLLAAPLTPYVTFPESDVIWIKRQSKF